MNNTEKRLEEFDRWFDKVWFDTRESHSCVGRNTLKKLVKSFISESIQQALAEERERVREKIWQIREDTRNDGQIQHIACYDNLLSSLKEKNP